MNAVFNTSMRELQKEWEDELVDAVRQIVSAGAGSPIAGDAQRLLDSIAKAVLPFDVARALEGASAIRLRDAATARKPSHPATASRGTRMTAESTGQRQRV